MWVKWGKKIAHVGKMGDVLLNKWVKRGKHVGKMGEVSEYKIMIINKLRAPYKSIIRDLILDIYN